MSDSARWTVILGIGLVILAAVVSVCLLAKLFRLAIGLTAAALLIGLLFRFFWGDGGDWLQPIADLLPEPWSTTVVNLYDRYRQQEQQDPILDAGKVEEQTGEAVSKALDTGKNLLDTLADALARALPEPADPASG